MGYDTPRSLGDRETGGGLSLPIWISFMETALKGVPVMPSRPRPRAWCNVGGEWYYDEYAPGGGVASLGVGHRRRRRPAEALGPTARPVGSPAPPPEERNRILDLFRN